MRGDLGGGVGGCRVMLVVLVVAAVVVVAATEAYEAVSMGDSWGLVVRGAAKGGDEPMAVERAWGGDRKRSGRIEAAAGATRRGALVRCGSGVVASGTPGVGIDRLAECDGVGVGVGDGVGDCCGVGGRGLPVKNSSPPRSGSEGAGDDGGVWYAGGRDSGESCA